MHNRLNGSRAKSVHDRSRVCVHLFEAQKPYANLRLRNSAVTDRGLRVAGQINAMAKRTN